MQRPPALAPALLLLLIACAPAQDSKPDKLTALEKKILGTWYGPDCGGDYTFKPDDTFTMVNFGPSDITLTGTWSIRWDALPPTLVITATTSDFTTKNGGRAEYEFLNKPLEYKLVQLDEKTISYQTPDGQREITFARDREGGSSKPVK
jgi:hypothetical protein